MDYRTIRLTNLRKDHSRTSEALQPLQKGISLKSANEKAKDNDDSWVKVIFTPPGGGPVTGWVLEAHCEEIADLARPDVKVDGFVRNCLMAEASFNNLPMAESWFVAADYLLARAVIETGITNAGAKIAGSDAVGPLQVSSAEWDAFLKDGGAFAKDFEPGDRDDAQLQIYGAAYRMHADAKSISEAKGKKGIGTKEDPFIPSYLDIFHAYLTNSADAAVAIFDAQNSDADKNKPLNEVLKGVLKDEEIAAFLKSRSDLTGGDKPKSVSEFAAATEALVNEALKKAFDLIKEHSPENLATIRQGEAPWLDVAKQLEQDGIAEPNPKILTFFDSTDFRPRPTTTATPWCGAFAAHCIRQSGDPTAAGSVPKGAAAAVNWKTWGATLSVRPEEVPDGAVVVLSPGEGAGGTGHVGFFVGFSPDGKKVMLLGGNQSNKVMVRGFPTSRIVAIRWLDLGVSTAAQDAADESADVPPSTGTGTTAPAGGAGSPGGNAGTSGGNASTPGGNAGAPGGNAGAPGGGQASAKLISDKARNLIVASEISSEAAYRKRYCRPEWPQGASGVTIGIGYDCGYTTGDKLRQDWHALPAAMLQALAQTVGVKGGPAGPLARQLRDSVNVPWEDALAVFDNRDVPRWVAIVRKALPNTELLSPDCLGALVSLAYNRGASFSKAGDRYREMRAIKTHMANKDFAKIPAEFRSMKRLWPSLRGLQVRRDQEADLFQSGLAANRNG